MKFNHDIFFNYIRPLHWRWCKEGLSQSQVDGINFLLAQVERDSIWKSIETVAYSFATTAWETAWTFQPIDERGGYSYFERRYGFQTKVGKRLGNDAPGEGAKYHGRGDVQLTGEGNYENAEERLRRFYPELIREFEARTGQKFDLTDFPDQAKDPLIAYAIMALGMHQGWFTGKSFSSYKTNRYLQWRRIINGTDHNDEIASIAEAFEKALRASFITENLLIKTDNQIEPAGSVGTTQTPVSNPVTIPQSSDIASQSQTSDESTNQPVQTNLEESPESLAVPSFGGYISKAQEKISQAQETIGAASGAIDHLKIIKDALDTGKDGKKSLWSTIGQGLYQMIWAVLAFVIGLPLEVWLVVALIVAIVGVMYLYRQNSLGKIRETARLKLIDLADYLK